MKKADDVPTPSPSVMHKLLEWNDRVGGVIPDDIRVALASDATPAPTSGSEDGGETLDAAIRLARYQLNRGSEDMGVGESDTLRRMVAALPLSSAALAKPASEPAGGVRWTVDNLLPIARRINKSGRGLVDLSALDALADELNAALSFSAGPAGEAVAWRAAAHPETGMGTMVNQIKWMLVDDADRLYGPGKWDLQELVPLGHAHPAPATVESGPLRSDAAAYDFVAGWHERQAKLFREMADDEPRTAEPVRKRAFEAAVHHAASAAALRNRASDERRAALAPATEVKGD